MVSRSDIRLTSPRADRVLLIVALLAVLASLVFAKTASASRGGAYAADVIAVGYAPAPARGVARTARTVSGTPLAATHRLRLPRGVSMSSELRRLRAGRDVRWAVPDYVAHTADAIVPNDPGIGNAPKDWEQLQWNLAGTFGVDAPEAWANVAAAGAPVAAPVLGNRNTAALLFPNILCSLRIPYALCRFALVVFGPHI